MTVDARIPCLCSEDAEGNVIPNERCEQHWHQVIDVDDPPTWQFQ